MRAEITERKALDYEHRQRPLVVLIRNAVADALVPVRVIGAHRKPGIGQDLVQ